MATFGDLVRKSGLLPPDRLAFALEEEKRTGFRLGQILVDHGFASETELFDAIADASGQRRLDMSTAQVDLEVALQIDPEWALDHRMMPLSVDEQEREVIVATTDPTQSALLADVAGRFGAMATPVVATESELGRLIRHAYFSEPLDRSPGGASPLPRVPADRAPTEARTRTLPSFPSNPGKRPPPDAITEPSAVAPRGLAYPTRSEDTHPDPPSVRARADTELMTGTPSPKSNSTSGPAAPLQYVRDGHRSVPRAPTSVGGLRPGQGARAPTSAGSLLTGESAGKPNTGGAPRGPNTGGPASAPSASGEMPAVPRSTRSAIPSSDLSVSGPFTANGPASGLGLPSSNHASAAPISNNGSLGPSSNTGPLSANTGPLGPLPKPGIAFTTLAPVVEMHQYTATAIEAIFELCVARGIITREEYLARLGTFDDDKGQS